MVKYSILLLSLFLSINVFSQYSNDKKVNYILSNTILKYSVVNNDVLSYKAKQMNKAFDDETFFENVYDCYFMKSDDKLFGGYFHYFVSNENFNCAKLYDGKMIYVVEDSNKKKYRSFDIGKNEVYPILNSVDGRVVVFNKYLNHQTLDDFFSNAKSSIRDTLMSNTSYLIHKTNHADDGEVTERYVEFYINKETHFIDKIYSSATYHDQLQQILFEYSNIKVQKDVNREKFLANEWFKFIYDPSNTEEKFKRKEIENLAIGSNFISFEGLMFPQKDSINISSDENQIILLDFWYTSCMPCIKSIPHLNKIFEKYGDKIKVVGVNLLPDDIKDIERITKFQKRTPINYPIVLVDWEKYLNKFKLHSFPTVLLYDKTGKLVFSQVGFTEEENLYEKLDGIISDLL